jgi:hypothetical protein
MVQFLSALVGDQMTFKVRQILYIVYLNIKKKSIMLVILLL